MNITPKSQIDEENELRSDLMAKKQAYARMTFEYQKTHPGFTGTAEQVAQLEDRDTKSRFFAAYADCAHAATLVNASGTWFNDVQKMIEDLRKAEENSTEEN